jgi:hypothetical protein
MKFSPYHFVEFFCYFLSESAFIEKKQVKLGKDWGYAVWILYRVS